MTDAPVRVATPTAFTRETQRKLTTLRVTAYSLATCFMIVMVVRGVWITRNEMEAEVDRTFGAAAVAMSTMASAGSIDQPRARAVLEVLSPPGVTYQLDTAPGARANELSAINADHSEYRIVDVAGGQAQLIARIDHSAIWNSALRTNLPFILFVLALGLPTVVIFLYMGWLVNRPALELLAFAQSGGGEVQHPPELPKIWHSVLARLKELRDSQAQMQAFLDNAPIGMMFRHSAGNLVMINRFGASFYQLGTDELIAQPISFFDAYFPDSKALARPLFLDPLAGTATTVETEFHGPSGERMNLLIKSFPVRNRVGTVELIGNFFVDVTEERRARAELIESRESLHQSEKLAAFGSMLAGVSHELNNPLAAVIGQAALLAEDLEGTRHADRIGKIRRAADRCARIVQSFLAMARQKTPEYRSVNLNDQVRSAVELTEYQMRAANVIVDLRLADDLPAIEADSDQLHQVIANLLNNARQALEEVAGERRITVITTPAAHSIRLAVADTGRGIDAATRDRVFDPFFTTKAVGAGTGIGLSYSRGVIEAHGGTIGIEDSEPGTTFVITLPLQGEGVKPSMAEAASPVATKGRALIIDDEADVAETLADMLARLGIEASVAIGGAAGQAAMANGAAFDLVLSDIRMPDLDGPALFAWIKTNRPDLIGAVAFVTGDTLSGIAADFLEGAQRPVLEKPFTPAALRKLVAEMLLA